MFRLCLALGVKHPNYLKLDFWELEEWYAYFRLNPFGHDIDTMMRAKVVAGMSGGKPDDYMPKITKQMELGSDAWLSQFSGLHEFMEQIDGNRKDA